MDRWLLQVEGETLGPLPLADIARGVKLGRVTATTKVCREGETQWWELWTVAELSGLLAGDASAARKASVRPRAGVPSKGDDASVARPRGAVLGGAVLLGGALLLLVSVLWWRAQPSKDVLAAAPSASVAKLPVPSAVDSVLFPSDGPREVPAMEPQLPPAPKSAFLDLVPHDASLPPLPGAVPPPPPRGPLYTLVTSANPSDWQRARDILEPKVFGSQAASRDEVRMLRMVCKAQRDWSCIEAIGQLR